MGDLRAAAAREVEEESGLVVAEDDLRHCADVVFGDDCRIVEDTTITTLE